jgi:CheY-like chemotaxis protein
MKPRVLIVEDNEIHLSSNERYLVQISAERKGHVGIEEFIIDKAKNQKEAIALLKKAIDSSLPYDLLLLDLGLPINEETSEAPPERGLEILEFVQTNGGARGVIVASVFRDYEYVIEAFRRGAVDFIAKPYERGTLQQQVLKYFEVEGVRLLEQRIRDLMPSAEKGLAHRLGACFSRFVQAVVSETEGLEEGFKERWGLDIQRDSEDSQVQHLLAVHDAVSNAKREWAETLSSLIGGEEALGVCVVEELLSEIQAEVQPCLALKRVKLMGTWNGTTSVRTFRDEVDDVKAVLKEIILGALSQLASYGESQKEIKISVSTNDGRAEVRFEDKLPPINDKAVNLISRGIIIPPGQGFGRDWGLSVAQHLALRGGGRIKVAASDEGNVITYSIPLADHA